MAFKSKKPSKKPVEKTRKKLRKEKRQQKKVNRAQYYSNKKKIFAGKDTDLDDSLIKNNNNNIKNEIIVEKKPKVVKKMKTDEALIKEKLRLKKKREKRAEKQRLKQKRELLIEDQEKEDKMIRQLEKKLKLNKRKSKSVPKSFVDDGLDYLLDFCSEKNSSDKKVDYKCGLMKNALMEFDSDDNLSDDEPPAKKKKSKVIFDAEIEDEELEINSGSEEDFSDELDGSEEEPEVKKINKTKSKDSKIDKKSKMTSESDEEDFDNELGEDEEEEEEEEENKSKKNSDETWEDIYGRKRDKDGNIINEKASTGKYIPPAIRLKQLEESTAHQEKLQQLRKQMKGLINRLAEHNMHFISTQIEDMYMSNSRHDMNEMLTKLMTESLVSPVLTPDRLVAEYMLLVVILHANVGTEVGAHFLLSLVKKINEMLAESQDVEDKTLDNYVFMLSHLYNFKVFGSQLLFQILQKLAEKFTEKEIECILLILRTVGFLLRKDDPLALKELIINLQQKASAEKVMSSRVQFMLEVLMAIKNNNMKKIPQYDTSHVEHLKKLLKNFLHKGNSVTQFNISLSDLLNANEKGKWWIVGSAWSGTIDSASKPTKDKNSNGSMQFSQQILELARKQRMNTDVRRNIFCILMSAEDYLDAFEKIQHLGLKDQQAREIINVIMDCCLQEKKFNPYYAILAQKFCNYDRKNQMTLQYSLWDKFRELDELNKVQLNNLAKFLTHLFVEKGLALSVLKVISFAELDKQTMKLVRQIMLGILLHDDAEACTHAFERISLAPQLQNLREGLRLFISYFLAKYAEAQKLPDKSVKRLQERTELVEKILYGRSSLL
ncbi:nucleolar MIF4G domain-containing protein 1 [Cotesia typhae]|uniref:nucleolar MIF4G domain-containing protein 1 n=1 Tax=Cotesia typhae TaxID=2053667 RepID=UPI003D68BDAF